MKHFKETKPTDYLLALVFTFLFISLAVIVAINFKPLYYLDIKLLDIPEKSGMAKKEILENYNALISYCSPFFTGPLSLPSLPSSSKGIQHFKEVKDIFNLLYYIFFISLPISGLIIFLKSKKKDYSYLFATFIVSILLPLGVGLILIVNFETAFVKFHEIFFNNNYWILNSVTDPIINILPKTFFLHSGILVVAIIILCSLVSLVIYHKKRVFNKGETL